MHFAGARDAGFRDRIALAFPRTGAEKTPRLAARRRAHGRDGRLAPGQGARRRGGRRRAWPCWPPCSPTGAGSRSRDAANRSGPSSTRFWRSAPSSESCRPTQPGRSTCPRRIGDAFGDPPRRAHLQRPLLLASPHRRAAAGRGQGARRGRRIVGDSGCDTLSFFALRDDKSYFFSPTGRSFLAYRVLHGVALVSGDPIGDEAEAGELVAEFRRVAQARGWRTAILASQRGAASALHVHGPQADLPRGRGGRRAARLLARGTADPQGATVRHAARARRATARAWSRFGTSSRGLRTSYARSRRSGAAAGPSAASRWRWTASSHIPRRWSRSPSATDGHVGGFIHLVPVPATGGLSLASMRRRDGEPNGLMEFLLARTIEWARERDVPEFSLNFSVFAQLILNPTPQVAVGSAFRPPPPRPRSSRSTACCASTANSSRSGVRATSASRAGSTSRSSALPTCARSPCSRRRGRGCAHPICPHANRPASRASSACAPPASRRSSPWPAGRNRRPAACRPPSRRRPRRARSPRSGSRR